MGAVAEARLADVDYEAIEVRSRTSLALPPGDWSAWGRLDDAALSPEFRLALVAAAKLLDSGVLPSTVTVTLRGRLGSWRTDYELRARP